MKKLSLILYLAFSSLASFAQFYDNQDSQLSWSITGGSAISFFQVKSANNLISNSFNPVGYGGVSLDYKINDYFSISPALSFAGKGGQLKSN